jgi:hypothetical protein
MKATLLAALVSGCQILANSRQHASASDWHLSTRIWQQTSSAVPLQWDRVEVMDHDLPLVPVVAGVLLVYGTYFAYTLFHRAYASPAR